MVRCSLADSGLPCILRTEPKLNAAYLGNGVLHVALDDAPLFKALYGKEADLGNLRAIGARKFVHLETHTKKLEPRA